MRTDTSAPASNVATIDPAAWLASLLPSGRPRRIAQMYARGPAKYCDIPKDEDPPASWLHDHISGTSTYATTLDRDGLTRQGIADIDGDTPETGRAALMDAYLRVRDAGLQATAHYFENAESGHYGGHIWVIYAEWVSADAVAAQLRTILPDVSEIWPCNQVIRLPFGYHQRAKSYGELWYTTAGELQHYDMDKPRRRSAAIELVMGLPTNAAPDCPPLISKPAPPKLPTRKISPGEQAAESMALTERYALARAYILDNYDLVSELKAAGAVETRSGYSCPFHGHSHETTLTIADDGRAGYSHSPNCEGLYSERGFDVTNVLILAGAYVNFDKLARALAPHCFPQPKPKAQQQRQTPDYLTTAERERRHKDAARKRAARKQAAADLRADVMGRAATDDTLTGADRAVLDTLLTIAGDRGWCKPSKERIAEMSGYSLGSVKRALAKGGRLEGHYITSEGDGGAPLSTATRTFLRGSCFATENVSVSHDDPRIDHELESHDLPVVAYEGGAGGALPFFEAEARERQIALAGTRPNNGSDLSQIFDQGNGRATEQAAAEPGGATYEPAADWTAPKHKPVRKPTKVIAMQNKRKRTEKYRAMLDDPPSLSREYFKLMNKAKRCEGRQRDMLLELAAEVQHYRDLAYARRDDAVEAPALPPPHKQNSVVTPVTPIATPCVPDITPATVYHPGYVSEMVERLKAARMQPVRS